jgi:putative aldouronate transport system permease protein
VASVSFSSASAFERGLVTFYPREFTLQAYKLILKAGTVPKSYMNTIIYTVVGTGINLLMTAMMAYPLSRSRLPFRKFYNQVIIITMFFGGGLIPQFLLIQSLHMHNTIWALVLPGAISAWNLIIMRTFFQSIPVELEESAYLDGANDFVIFIRIILPLSKAAIATIGLFYMVTHWNSWFSALLYLKDSEKYPLQLILRDIIMQGQMAQELAAQGDLSLLEKQTINIESIKYATLFASILPMMLVYPFIQKYFVKGVMVGSIKG